MTRAPVDAAVDAGACASAANIATRMPIPTIAGDHTTRARPGYSPGWMRSGGWFALVAVAIWVIVTGRIGGQGDQVVNAHFCKLSAPQKDQLSDDELDRLASPGAHRGGDAKGKLDCPPAP
jgi:hypothetical protein